MMKRQDFLVGWRLLVREPLYSLIAVLGLSVGFAACMLLLGFVQYSWSYDAHVPDAQQVYVVKQRYNVDPNGAWFDQAPLLLRNVAARTPGVAQASAYLPATPMTLRHDGTARTVTSLTVLPGFAQALGLRAIEGDLAAALERPDGLALTATAATRLFGTAHALDRVVHVDQQTLRVAAILPDTPANTTIPFAVLRGVQSASLSDDIRQEVLSGTQGSWGKLVIRLQPGTAPGPVALALQQALDSSPAVQNVPPEVRQRLGDRKVMEMELLPLRDAYFDRAVAANPMAGGQHGDRGAVLGLAVVAVLILALAAVNYVNLATVRVLHRQREIGLRKMLGADARQLLLQFLAESLMVALLATVLGLLLARLALPLFAELMDRQLDGVFSPANVGAAILIGLVLGAITSVHPAWIAVRVRPAVVLGGRANAESAGGARLRRILTVLQIAAAIGLSSVTVAIASQTHYAMERPPGFDPAPLLIVDLPAKYGDSEKTRGLVEALGRQRDVAGVAMSEDAVGRLNNAVVHDLKRAEGAGVPVDVKFVSASFFNTYQLSPVAGRLFDPQIDQENDAASIVINALAARQLGFATPQAAVGQLVSKSGEGGKPVFQRIIGVAPELRFRSLHEAPRAVVFELSINWAATLSLRAAGSLSDVEAAVESLGRQYFPDQTLETHRAGDVVASNYADDARFAKLLALASAITLLIMAFGMYVLSAYTVQRREREIVLRKLYGAGRGQIGRLLAREFGLMTLAAALLGLPLAGLAIMRYLAGFVEHSVLAYWTPWAALAAVSACVALAATRHTLEALRLRPSQALRS